MEDAFASTNYPLTSCEQPKFSFYQLIDQISLQDDQGRNVSAYYPLHRFCSLMRKMGARSLLREKLALNPELLNEQKMLSAARSASVRIEAIRLTAFRSLAGNGASWSDKLSTPDNDLLGYAVVIRVLSPKRFRSSYMYESVVSSPSLVIARNSSPMISEVANYYVHNSRAFITTIGPQGRTREMPLRGSFFSQQNGVTHVCAHAALRMAINSSPRFARKKKLTCDKINQILGLNWADIPKGLDQQQMKEVIEEVGGTVQLADFYTKPAMEYDQFVYPLMESGCPVILNVHGRSFNQRRGQPAGEEVGHAVAVMGHTINTDRWEPEARGGYGSYPRNPYLPAAQWTDHLIISDDNFGMYVTLPSDSLRNLLIPQKNPTLHAAVALGVVPKGVRLSGYMAEQRAGDLATLLKHGIMRPEPYWLSQLIDGPPVCRTLLQTRAAYIAHLREAFRDAGAALDKAIEGDLLKQLPERLWVTELSLPNLYSANKRKVGEVILDAGSREEEHAIGKSLIAVRLPGLIFLAPGSGKNYPITLTSHTPLIMDNGQDRLCDW